MRVRVGVRQSGDYNGGGARSGDVASRLLVERDLKQRREGSLAERGLVALEEIAERIHGARVTDRIHEVLIDGVAPIEADRIVLEAARAVADDTAEGAGSTLLDVGAGVVAE